MTNIHVRFDEAKAAQAMARVIARNGGQFDYYLTHKILYALERESWLRWGRPVFGGTYKLFDFGPLIKDLYDASKGSARGFLRDHISREDFIIKVDRDPGSDLLSEVELEALDRLIDEWSGLNFNEAKAKAHAFAECGTAVPHGRDEISAEAILRAGGKTDEDISIVAEEMADADFVARALRRP